MFFSRYRNQIRQTQIDQNMCNRPKSAVLLGATQNEQLASNNMI